jgi:hypothetical protein
MTFEEKVKRSDLGETVEYTKDEILRIFRLAFEGGCDHAVRYINEVGLSMMEAGYEIVSPRKEGMQ